MNTNEQTRFIFLGGVVDHGRNTLIESLLSGTPSSSSSCSEGGLHTVIFPANPSTSITAHFFSDATGRVCPPHASPARPSVLHPTLALCDGALWAVDMVEGAGPPMAVLGSCMLNASLGNGIRDHVFFLNKLDRMFCELRCPTEDIFETCSRIFDSVTRCLGGGDADGNDDDDVVSPSRLIFGSAKFGWGFSLHTFGKMYAAKFGVDESKMCERLWGDSFFDAKNKKWIKSEINGDGERVKRAFCQFCLDPINQLFDAVMTEKSADKLNKMLTTLDLHTVDDDLASLCDKSKLALIHAIMRRWMPIAAVVGEAASSGLLPSPKQAQQRRSEFIVDSHYVRKLEQRERERARPGPRPPQEAGADDDDDEDVKQSSSAAEFVDPARAAALAALRRCDSAASAPFSMLLSHTTVTLPLPGRFAVGRIFSGALQLESRQPLLVMGNNAFSSALFPRDSFDCDNNAEQDLGEVLVNNANSDATWVPAKSVARTVPAGTLVLIRLQGVGVHDPINLPHRIQLLLSFLHGHHGTGGGGATVVHSDISCRHPLNFALPRSADLPVLRFGVDIAAEVWEAHKGNESETIYPIKTKLIEAVKAFCAAQQQQRSNNMILFYSLLTYDGDRIVFETTNEEDFDALMAAVKAQVLEADPVLAANCEILDRCDIARIIWREVPAGPMRRSAQNCMAKSPNKQNQFDIFAVPLAEEVAEELVCDAARYAMNFTVGAYGARLCDSGFFSEVARRAKKLLNLQRSPPASSGGAAAASKTPNPFFLTCPSPQPREIDSSSSWRSGKNVHGIVGNSPSNVFSQHPRCLASGTPLNHDYVTAAALFATDLGPLADETVHGVHWILDDMRLHADERRCGAGQVIPTLRAGCMGSLLDCGVRFAEPVLFVEIVCSAQLAGMIADELREQRRAYHMVTSRTLVSAYVPVSSSFGLHHWLRVNTGGLALVRQFVLAAFKTLKEDPMVAEEHDPADEHALGREVLRAIRSFKGCERAEPKRAQPEFYNTTWVLRP